MGYTLIDESGAPAKGRYTLVPDNEPKKPAFDPTEGMSTTEKVLAGIGKAFVDTGRGVGQLFGLVSDKDIEEARRLDAPLMATTAGKVGNFGGAVAQALPTALIPGANTLTGAALIGAGQGFIQPTVGDESRLSNAAIGGAAGAGGVAAGRALIGGARAAKALVEPFSQSGRNKIAGRVLERFADDPAAIASVRGGPTATGAMPTLAERTGDRGLAQLQDSLRSVDPQIANRISSRLADNNAARIDALRSLAGTSAQRDAAEATRTAATRDLYQQATNANYAVDQELVNLLRRPAVAQAMKRAETLAANEGRPFAFTTDPNAPFSGLGVTVQRTRQVTGQGLQDLKMAMDEMLSDPTSGFAGKAGDTIRSLRGKLVSWMEEANPAFKNARQSYAAASKPLNAMDAGEYIAQKATSNTSDLAGNPRMMANSLLGTLRDEQKLLRAATGRKELKSLDQVFSPEQLATLRAVASETDRAAAVASAGNGPGSATAQRMAAQNILRQLVGPTGLPESWAESALASTVVGKPLNLVYGGVAEPKIQQTLADALLDPDKARAVLQAARQGQIRLPDNLVSRLLLQSARVTPSSLTVSGER